MFSSIILKSTPAIKDKFSFKSVFKVDNAPNQLWSFLEALKYASAPKAPFALLIATILSISIGWSLPPILY